MPAACFRSSRVLFCWAVTCCCLTCCTRAAESGSPFRILSFLTLAITTLAHAIEHSSNVSLCINRTTNMRNWWCHLSNSGLLQTGFSRKSTSTRFGRCRSRASSSTLAILLCAMLSLRSCFACSIPCGTCVPRRTTPHSHDVHACVERISVCMQAPLPAGRSADSSRCRARSDFRTR